MYQIKTGRPDAFVNHCALEWLTKLYVGSICMFVVVIVMVFYFQNWDITLLRDLVSIQIHAIH